jgi:hypothetical protein
MSGETLFNKSFEINETRIDRLANLLRRNGFTAWVSQDTNEAAIIHTDANALVINMLDRLAHPRQVS